MNYKDEINKIVDQVTCEYVLIYFYTIMNEVISDMEAVESLRVLQDQSDLLTR